MDVEGKRSLATLELLKLAKENPGLPIIARVYPDVIDDSCVWCYGEVTGACIEGVLTSKFNGKCRTWTLSEALISSHVFVRENPGTLKAKIKEADRC